MTEEEKAEAKKQHIYELHNRARRMRFEPWQWAVAMRVAAKQEQQQKASA